MIEERPFSNRAAELRHRAEKICREKTSRGLVVPQTLSPDDEQLLLHESQVHQEELEIQNEDLRQAHEQLDTLRTRYFDLYDLAPVGYFSITQAGIILEANFTGANLLGVERRRLIDRRFTRWVFPEDERIYFLNHQMLFETGKRRIFELRMVKEDGTVFWGRIEAVMAGDPGSLTMCRAVLSDINESKGLEVQLLERIKELRCLCDTSALLSSPALSFDAKMVQTAVLIGKALQFPEISGVRIVVEGRTYQNTLFGETPWMVSLDIVGLGTPRGAITLSYLKERMFLPEELEMLGTLAEMIGHAVGNRQLVTSLRRSEERFREAIQATKEGIWEWDIQTNMEYFSPRWCEIIGYACDDPELPHTYNAWAERIHPDDREHVMRALKSHLSKGTPYDVDYRHQHKSGEYRWQNSIGNALFDDNGKPYRMVGCIRDISERKRAEQELRESEELYRSLFENMLNGFAYCRMLFEDGKPKDFIYLVVNKAFETQTGLKNVVGRKASEVIPGIRETDAQLLEIYGRVASGGHPERFEIFVEALRMWFSVSVYSPATEHFVAVFDVITERKQAETQLHFLSSQLLVSQENERHRIAMELHDQTGQDLTVLKMRLSALKNRFRKDQSEMKRECEDVLCFIDDLVENVRRLAHGLSPSQLHTLGLCGAVTMMLRNLSRNSSLHVDADIKDLSLVAAPEKEIILYRIFQEILTNISRHAGARNIRFTVCRQNKVLAVSVTDDGVGFDPTTLRMREPSGKGGMGLAAIELRASMLSAEFSIVSHPGQGTEIKLFVPINGEVDMP